MCLDVDYGLEKKFYKKKVVSELHFAKVTFYWGQVSFNDLSLSDGQLHPSMPDKINNTP